MFVIFYKICQRAVQKRAGVWRAGPRSYSEYPWPLELDDHGKHGAHYFVQHHSKRHGSRGCGQLEQPRRIQYSSTVRHFGLGEN